MPIYKFIKLKDPVNHFDKSDVMIKLETEDLDDLLETFAEFLKACGYTVDGELIIEESERDC